MNQAELLKMLARKGLTITGAFICGAWVATQYPSETAAFFKSSVVALIAALAGLGVSAKMSVDNQKRASPKE